MATEAKLENWHFFFFYQAGPRAVPALLRGEKKGFLLLGLYDSLRPRLAVQTAGFQSSGHGIQPSED